jgi:hypothetical protein
MRLSWYGLLLLTFAAIVTYWFGSHLNLPHSHLVSMLALIPFVLIFTALGLTIVVQILLPRLSGERGGRRDSDSTATPVQQVDLASHVGEVGRQIEELAANGGKDRFKQFTKKQIMDLGRRGIYVRHEQVGPEHFVHLPDELFMPGIGDAQLHLEVAKLCAAMPGMGGPSVIVCIPTIGEQVLPLVKGFLSFLRQVMDEVRRIAMPGFSELMWYLDVPRSQVEIYESLGLGLQEVAVQSILEQHPQRTAPPETPKEHDPMPDRDGQNPAPGNSSSAPLMDGRVRLANLLG